MRPNYQIELRIEMSLAKIIIIIGLSLYPCTSSPHNTVVDEKVYEGNPLKTNTFQVNGGDYLQREFKFIPDRDDWQRKFAETISKAVNEDKRDDFSHASHHGDELFNAPAREEVSGYQKSHAYVSHDGGRRVVVLARETDYSNETTTLKPETFDLKGSIQHIPRYQPEHYSNNEKGEILIHRPAPIIVNRPPTKVLVNHPPLIVKPAPVIFHRPPSVIVRQVFVKPKPETVKLQPVYVKVIKPAPEKIFIKEHISCGDSHFDSDYHSKKSSYPSPYQY